METSSVNVEVESKKKSFESLALPHMDSLYRYALYMSGDKNDAEDLVQDTYLRAYKFFDKFEKGTDCRAWLFRIMRNTFINKFRHDKRSPPVLSMSDIAEDKLELPMAPNTEIGIVEDGFSDEVYHAIAEIPEMFRTVVLLADVEDLSYKEIASAIGHPIGTVMSRLHRGRRMLRQSLGKYAM
jgi:RNA polymerase sigma-70 factor (ECF subfamily)